MAGRGLLRLEEYAWPLLEEAFCLTLLIPSDSPVSEITRTDILSLDKTYTFHCSTNHREHF